MIQKPCRYTGWSANCRGTGMRSGKSRSISFSKKILDTVGLTVFRDFLFWRYYTPKSSKLVYYKWETNALGYPYFRKPPLFVDLRFSSIFQCSNLDLPMIWKGSSPKPAPVSRRRKAWSFSTSQDETLEELVNLILLKLKMKTWSW